MRLRPKLILTFLLVAMISVGGLGVVVVDLISRAIERGAQEMIEHDMQMAWAEYLAQSQQMRSGMLRAAAEVAVQEMVRQQQAVALRTLMRTWQVYLPFADLWLVTDPGGRVIARINPGLSGANDTEQTGDTRRVFERLIAEAVARREPIFSTEVLPQASLARESLSLPVGGDGLLATVATPVLCDGVTVCGVIVTGNLLNGDSAVLDILREKLHGHLRDAAKGAEHQGPIVFISRRTSIVSAPLGEADSGSTLGDWMTEPILGQVEAGLPYRGTLTIHGVSFLVAIDPIRNSRGDVVGALTVGLPEQDFWTVRNEIVRAIVLILIFGVALAMGVAVVSAHHLTRPLQELTSKAQAIAGGDLSVRARLEGEDEISELGRAFNQMAQELQQSYDQVSKERRKILAAIEASGDAIWISDDSQHIGMVNSALERLTGHRRADLVGHSCRYLLGACVRDGRSICDAVCPFLHSESSGVGAIEGFIPTRAGKQVWIEISYGRVIDPDHRLASVIHIVRDLTQRKEVERLKDEFLSMVTHELRTPLHHIKGFATTLLQTDVQWDADTQRDFLETINHEADRLARLVENILQMSRIEAGELHMAEPHRCRIVDLTSGALRRLRDETRPFRLRVLVPDDLPPILADEQGLEVVIANLVENATKYSPSGSEITLHAETRDGHLVFCVADQGPGIPERHQPHIFERFYRVDIRDLSDAKPTRPVAGIGLGLAICKRIVEAHHGHIWVESAPSGGSRFFFDLPLENVERTFQAAPPAG